MSRRVYFAFHYQNDIWRVNEVRNSWVTKDDREAAGFYDASLWEEAKKESDIGIKRMINHGLQYTTVTCVLIGIETYKRRWVRYEIIKSLDRKNGLLGIYINGLKDQNGEVCRKGNDPFDDLRITLSKDGKSADVTVWENMNWIPYEDYPTISCNYKEEYGGNSYRLSKLGFKMYDWVVNDGYSNFNNWVEDSI